MWTLVMLLGAALPQQDAMRDLAAQNRWDEIIWRTEDRLAETPSDASARYWLGRASVERARILLEGHTFSRDLAKSILQRAREQLARVPRVAEGITSDAAEWEAFARYLIGGDADLAGDLEQWFEQDEQGYAAYLRGLIALDARDAAASTWIGRAATASPDRPSFALAWANALAREGRRREALGAWDLARDRDAELAPLLESLLSILPGDGNAATRLAKVDTLMSHDHAEKDGLLEWYRAFSLEQLGRVTEAEQAMSMATSNRTWDVDRAHARLLRLLGRRSEAAALLSPAAREGDERSLEQLINLADATAQLRLWDEALGYYDTALGIEPLSERAGLNRALLMAQSGRCLAPYRSAVVRYRGRADVLNDAALAAWGWRQFDQARAWFAEAAEMPGASDARENLAALLLASDTAAGRHARALLDAVLAGEPGRDRALFLRHLARPSTSR